MGEPGQSVPQMTDEYISSVSERYIELYEQIVGKPFEKANPQNINERINNNVASFLASYQK